MPMAKPAPTAIGIDTMPPTIAAAKPLMLIRNNRSGLDDTTTDARAIPAIPAIIDPPTHDTTASRLDDTPNSEATSRLVADARTARPVAVYLKNTKAAAASPRVRPMTPKRSQLMLTPNKAKAGALEKMACWFATVRSLAPKNC